MEVILMILCCMPGLLFAVICFDIMDSNKDENGYNSDNSMLGLQCDASEKCDFRYSSMCDNCKHNCSDYKCRNSYVRR